MYILGNLFYKYKRKIIPLICKNFCSQLNSNERKLKLLFFGTDKFSLQSLIKLQNARFVCCEYENCLNGKKYLVFVL